MFIITWEKIETYYKKRTPSGAIIYSGSESINEPDDMEKALIDYALKAVCALGITDGPVHGEYTVRKSCRMYGVFILILPVVFSVLKARYQMITRSSGARYMPSPSVMP